MNSTTKLPLVALFALAALHSTHAAPNPNQVPYILNYQGRVTVGGTNLTTNALFKFALVDGSGTTTYWNNDQTQVWSSEPVDAVSIAVVQGLYSTLLGDSAIPNMAWINPDVFLNNSDVNLRVWFSADGTNFVQLSPDQRIVSSGYALRAAVADNVTNASGDLSVNGTVSADQLVGGFYNTATGFGGVGGGRFSASSDFGFIGAGSGNTVGGGGGSYSFIGAGSYNINAGSAAAISGGYSNAISEFVNSSFIGAGSYNTNAASDAVIGGGEGNTIGDSLFPGAGSKAFIGAGSFNTNGGYDSFIGAGGQNTVNTYVNHAFIGAGYYNNNSGYSSFIGAGEQNTNGGYGAFIGAGSFNTNQGGSSAIVGGEGNVVAETASTAFIGAGSHNNNSGYSSFIGAGEQNTVNTYVNHAFIGAGYSNNNSNYRSFIGAGSYNANGGFEAFIGAGSFNTNQGSSSAIVGGVYNVVAETASTAFIGAGSGNSNGGSGAFIGAGYGNTNFAEYSTIGGGEGNVVGATFEGSADGGYGAVVAGGSYNTNVGDYSTIGGGEGNTVGGDYAAISGGEYNRAAGWGIIPGGYGNIAGTDSFAAGNLAMATNLGSFVWSGWYDESETVTTVSTNDYSFTVRAPGGVRFITTLATNDLDTSGLGSYTNGVAVEPGGTAWTALSDSNAKTAVKAIDPRSVLAKLDCLPVTEWEYKHDPHRRYFGPMAQDFHAAFGLGRNDKTINTLDADGVLFLSVKGLLEELKLRDKAIEELKAKSAEFDALKSKLEAVEERLNALPPAP